MNEMKPRLTTIFEGEQAEKLKARGITNFPDYKCPVCNRSVADITTKTKLHPDGWNKYNYCRNCGQKIDWN